MGLRVTDTETFILNSLDVHDGKYSYYPTTYVRSSEKVIITCPTHGDFSQTPNDHLKGSGCRECWRESRLGVSSFGGGGGGAYLKPLTHFLRKSYNVHGARYDYSEVEYTGSTEKVRIGCSLHGEFLQAPAEHYKGKGCSECGGVKPLTTSRFIESANKVHQGMYDYSLTNVVTNKIKVVITCKLHGPFKQIPGNHTQGAGCPSCSVTGFKWMLPAILYYFKVWDDQGNHAYKVGVTNNSVTKRYSKEERSRMCIISEKHFDRGVDAYRMEQDILRRYATFRYTGPPLLKVGNTELLTRNVSELDTSEES